MEEVPRCTSLARLASSYFVLCSAGMEAEGLLDYQGRAGIISIVGWNLRPVILGVDFFVSASKVAVSLPWESPRREGHPLKRGPSKEQGRERGNRALVIVL